jgi:hypothetical protein
VKDFNHLAGNGKNNGREFAHVLENGSVLDEGAGKRLRWISVRRDRNTDGAPVRLLGPICHREPANDLIQVIISDTQAFSAATSA